MQLRLKSHCSRLGEVVPQVGPGGVAPARVAVVLVAAAAGEAAPLAHKELFPAFPVAVSLGDAVDFLQVRLQGAALGEAFVAQAAAIRTDTCGQGQVGSLQRSSTYDHWFSDRIQSWPWGEKKKARDSHLRPSPKVTRSKFGRLATGRGF